ncbi:GNAT family N-acetyltransferase [Halobacillus amylolyticus]|uniref:GNAT family N-acetyltransferase n=1 Tax=Halobacillus amylolyticus TaxID=2932259 RepID=A0ABY4HDZ8_9BACI|nr:GNAT family N-acetyltransferase [Halobacillus amylolyticus]UOR12859.1 GNAT family N-acetyltransferase [Halobacillus amylolyticus]
MEGYSVKKIKNLYQYDITYLVSESKEEGFQFLERLVTDYKNGTNTFKVVGESIYGVFNNDGVLIAIGGVNVDPYSQKQNIGRLRRFYVSRAYRRIGIGRVLLKEIIRNAKTYYNVLVLHTDTEQANKFYTSLGFLRKNAYPKSTHFMSLK